MRFDDRLPRVFLDCTVCLLVIARNFDVDKAVNMFRKVLAVNVRDCDDTCVYPLALGVEEGELCGCYSTVDTS